MPAKRLDFSDFEERNTLLLTVPTYVDGKPTGENQEWKIPPLSLETEMGIRALQAKQMRELNEIMQKAKAKKEEGQEEVDLTDVLAAEEEVKLAADYWAPAVALFVREPLLDAEQLKTNYPGSLLRKIGQAASDFFLSGELEEEKETETAETETVATENQ